MLRLKLVFVFVLFFATFGANEIFACTCGGPRSVKNFQPCGLYWSSEKIFIGTAEKVSIETVGGNEQTDDSKMRVRSSISAREPQKYARMVARFSVEKAVRGVGAGESIEIETSPSTASCGYPFKEGEKYFVYLGRNKDGRYAAMLCSPIVPLKNAAVDLEYLKALENGERGTRVYGNVFERRRENYKQTESLQPLAGIEITLKGKKKTFKTATGDSGLYIFKEIPDDVYEIKIKIPENLREFVLPSVYRNNRISIGKQDSPPGSERYNRCASQNFTLTSQGVITGKVIGYDGTNPPQQFVSLIPVDENEKPVPDRAVLSVWTNRETGQFYLDPVPPGKYLLGINPRNCPGRLNHEFGKMFYPGVGSENDAAIIAVSGKEEKKIGDFHLLAPLKERWFSGIAFSADGKPLASTTVSLLDSANGCGTFSSLSETTTDEQGRFRLKGYETYHYRIRAFTGRDGGRRMSEIIEIPAAGNVENLQLTLSKTF